MNFTDRKIKQELCDIIAWFEDKGYIVTTKDFTEIKEVYKSICRNKFLFHVIGYSSKNSDLKFLQEIKNDISHS